MFWHNKVSKYDDPDAENTITVVHREESSPASTMRFIIAALFLVLAAITIGQQLYFQGQRTGDLKAQHARDRQFQKDQEALNAQLQAQIDESDQDRERLRTLVLGVLTAKTPDESRAILQKFIADSAKEAASPKATPRPSPRATFKNSSQPNPSPKATRHPSPRPSASRSSQPKPTPSPTRKPSPKPCILPNPLPRLPVICT